MTDIVDLYELITIAPDGDEERLLLAAHPLRPFGHLDPDRPNARILNRVAAPPAWGGDIYADPSRMTGTVTAGSLVLHNADGAMSYLAWHAWVSLVWRRGVPGTDFGAWEVVATARPQPPQWSVSDRETARLTITLYDLRADLDDAVQTSLMAGDAVGTTGLGGAADLKDRPLPLALGDLSTSNVSPPLANASLQIWRVHDGAGAGAPAAVHTLYYRGGDAGLSDIGDVGAAITTTALTDGQYSRWMAQGLIRVGGNVSGELTCDLTGPTAAGTTAPSLIKWLLQRRYGAGVALGPGFAGGLAGHAPAAAAVGLWVDEADTSYAALIERLCRSAALWCLPDEDGVWQLGAYAAPATPVGVIGVNDVVQIQTDAVDPPVWSVAVKWGRNHTVLSRGSIAEAVEGTDREAWLAQEWRTATVSDAAIKARYVNAIKVEIETELRTAAAADALAAHLFGVLSLRADASPRRGYQVAVPLDKWRGVAMGATLTLDWAAEGIMDDMVVMGRRLCSPDSHLMWLRLWG